MCKISSEVKSQLFRPPTAIPPTAIPPTAILSTNTTPRERFFQFQRCTSSRASIPKLKHFTDSLPCLQALLYMKLEHPLFGMVIQKYVFLNIANKDIIFCWVPSHYQG